MILPAVNFFGLKVSVFSKEELIESIEKCIDNKQGLVYYGWGFGTLPFFRKFPLLYKYANSFDIMVTDGRWFYLVCKLFRIPVKFEISIPNLVILTLRIAEAKGASLILFGAKKEINDRATRNIKISHPNINVYEGIEGYFNVDKEASIVDYINKRKPDILLVGISIPKKEEFIYKYRNRLGASLIVPCGGMIDVLACKTKQTPYIIKKLGLAGIYRLAQEPKRLIHIKATQFYEIFFRIFPSLFINVLIRNKKDFFIPSLYKIKREN